jgi:hypothetical protein
LERKVRDIKIGEIISKQQPKTYKKLRKNKKHKHKKCKNKEYLSFSDVKKLMQHDSYCRHNGAIRQVRHE